MGYRIVTDSTIDLTQKMIAELELTVGTLKFTIEGDPYEDRSDKSELPTPKFYSMLREGKMSITTQINTEEFTDLFEPILAAGEDILYIGFSSGLSGTFNMIDPDRDARERGIRQFEHQCEIAAMLNIPLVSLCTGSKNLKSKWEWHDDNLKESSWTELMHSTERILRFAETYGVVLGVETEVNNIINTAERARRYLDEFKSPNLKIIMDGANLMTAQSIGSMHAILDQAFDALGADIVSAHAKDLYLDEAGKIAYTAPGKGLLDFGYYIAGLKNAGYKGSLIMHGFGESDVAFSRDYLTKLI